MDDRLRSWLVCCIRFVGADAVTERITTTYSMWSTFRNCRRRCWYRYVEGLKPIDRDPNLHFGSVSHNWLELHHGGQSDDARRSIQIAWPSPEDAPKRMMAEAMFLGYVRRYAAEPFQVVELEKVIEGPIVNPETGRISRTFVLRGKVDGLIKIDGDYWLLEHKTAGTIDGTYLDRLWADFQIILYSYYLTMNGTPIKGVLYNILAKTRIRQKKGETQDEFWRRLVAKYQEPEMFHREQLFIGNEQYDDLLHDLWDLTQAYLEARKHNRWYKNPGNCFNWNRRCPYWPLCKGGDNEMTRANHYEVVEPHEELRT